MTATTQSPDVYAELHRDPDFVQLRKSFRGFAFPVTAAFLVWYLLYVVLSAFSLKQVVVDGKPKNVKTGIGELLSTPVFGDNLNVALVFGLLQFVSTFLIAYLYGRHARRKLDPLAHELREKAAAYDAPQQGRRMQRRPKGARR